MLFHNFRKLHVLPPLLHRVCPLQKGGTPLHMCQELLGWDCLALLAYIIQTNADLHPD